MKQFGKWLAKVIGKALALVLFVVLLPYGARLMETIFPDMAGTAIDSSVVISQKLTQSARLETQAVDTEGAFTATVNAALIGNVQTVHVTYSYHASLGIDLQAVTIRPDGSSIVIVLPQPVLLSDSLVPGSVSKNDFWYPLSEKRRQALLDAEREKLSEGYLTGAISSAEFRQATETALTSTFGQWVSLNGLTIRYEWPVAVAQEEP